MFIDINGVIKQSKSSVSSGASVHDEDVKEPVKLAEILRRVIRRLAELEANRPQKFIDFESEVGDSGTTSTFVHNFGGPVRYTVVFWTKTGTGSYPTAAPVLVADSDSTDNQLVLKSYVVGKVILRVEPAQHNISYFTA